MPRPMVRRSELPDEWPEGFHPLMGMTRRGKPPNQRAGTDEAAAWHGMAKDPRTVDVEANEDALLDFQRGVQAFTDQPTTMAPPPGTPTELRARHELAPEAFPIGYELVPAQHRQGPQLVRPLPADFIATGTLALTAGAQPVQVVGGDPYRKRLLLTATGQVWLVGGSQQVQDVGGGIASTGMLINANTAAPLVLETTGAVFAWAAFNGAVLTWLAEVYKAGPGD